MDVRRVVRAVVGVACVALASLLLSGPARASSPFSVSIYGNFFIRVTDFSTQGGLGLQVGRSYNSFSSTSSGRFGAGWETQSETYLKIQDDGSIVVHEYGHGAKNRFNPTTSSLRPQTQIVGELMQAAERMGQFGNDADRDAYRRWLALDDNAENAWENFVSLGLLKRQDPPVGETFFSGRFAPELLTRVPEGYERSTKYSGGILLQAFDLSGRLVRYWDANRDYIGLNYAPNGQLREAFDNEGHRFIFSYGADGLVSGVKDSQGHVLRYQYENSDLVSVDVNGKVTRYDYDDNENLIGIQFPDRTSMKMTYNKDGQVTSFTDTDRTLITYTYGPQPSSSSQAYTFETDTRKPSGESHHKSSQYFFDTPSHYYKQVETDDGVVVANTTYNANEDPLTIATPKGTTTYTYDPQERLELSQTSTGTTVKWEYDQATGNVLVVTRTNKDSVVTEHFEYDERGNLTRAYDSGGHDFSISRDPYQRISAVTGVTLELSFEYADNLMFNPATVVLGGIGSVRISYLADGTVANAQSSGGAAVVNEVRTTLQMVDDLIKDSGTNVVTLPAPSAAAQGQ